MKCYKKNEVVFVVLTYSNAPAYPNCLQTTWASLISHKSAHTGYPSTCTFPSPLHDPPCSVISGAEERKRPR